MQKPIQKVKDKKLTQVRENYILPVSQKKRPVTRPKRPVPQILQIHLFCGMKVVRGNFIRV